MNTQYCLRYCYRYEPGFSVYSIWDIVLYIDNDTALENDFSGEIRRYLEKEEKHIEKADESQVFFRTSTFEYPLQKESIEFLKLVLYPVNAKDDSVVNLVYHPLEKKWDNYNKFEQIAIIDTVVKEQEKEVGIEYKLIRYYNDEIYVENFTNPEEYNESDDSIIEITEQLDNEF